jgi:glycosyltransferase involved in cell wall biosynthesis
MDRNLRVSVIIVNYNYGRFLGAAIESALAQTWKDVEVIVVDDGSTDESPEVIARYADRIKAIRKANGGQGSAFNAGFEHSTGQLVILLDADDMLHPTRVARVVDRYRPGVSKIQCVLDTVDAGGGSLGMPFPHYPPDLSADKIKRQTLEFSYYPCAPASGNVYAREYLTRVLPIPAAFRYNADGYLNICAPLYGDVETIPETLGAYRVHGANSLAMKEVVGTTYATHIGYDLLLRRTFLAKAAELGYAVDERSLPLTKNHLENRLLSLRLAPKQHVVPEDSAMKLVALGIRSAWVAPDVSALGRLLWTAWFLVIGFLPRHAVIYLVKRFRLQNFRTRIAKVLVSKSRKRP